MAGRECREASESWAPSDGVRTVRGPPAEGMTVVSPPVGKAATLGGAAFGGVGQLLLGMVGCLEFDLEAGTTFGRHLSQDVPG